MCVWYGIEGSSSFTEKQIQKQLHVYFRKNVSDSLPRAEPQSQ